MSTAYIYHRGWLSRTGEAVVMAMTSYVELADHPMPSPETRQLIWANLGGHQRWVV